MRIYLLFPGTYKSNKYGGVVLSETAGSIIQRYHLDPKECIVIPERMTAEQCGYNADDFICIFPRSGYDRQLPTQKGVKHAILQSKTQA